MRHKKIPADYTQQMDSAGNVIFVYNGPEYVLEWPTEQKRWFCIFALLIPIAALAVFTFMGFLNADNAKQVYSVLLYVSMPIPLVLLLIAAMRVCFVGRILWRQDYQRTIALMRTCTVIVQCLAVLLLIALILFMLFFNSTTEEADRSFTMDTAIIFLLLTFFHWLQSHVRCVRMK